MSCFKFSNNLFLKRIGVTSGLEAKEADYVYSNKSLIRVH
jgi:hypothetical protein